MNPLLRHFVMQHADGQSLMHQLPALGPIQMLQDFVCSPLGLPGKIATSALQKYMDIPYQFKDIKSMAIDQHGNLFVLDSNTVHVLKPDGTALFTFGSKGKGDDQFEQADDLTIGFDSNVYIADSFNRVLVFRSSDGAFERSFRIGFKPASIAVASDGMIYVSSFHQHNLHLFRPDGTFVQIWTPMTPLHIEQNVGSVNSLKINQLTGVITVCDYQAGQIHLYSSDRHYLRRICLDRSLDAAVAMTDVNNRIVIACFDSNDNTYKLQVVDSKNDAVLHSVDAGANLISGKGLLIDSQGQILFATREHIAIYK